MSVADNAEELASLLEGWDRFILESGAGDWLDSHELPDTERALVIKALRAYAKARRWGEAFTEQP